jgi:hypothetical protein
MRGIWIGSRLAVAAAAVAGLACCAPIPVPTTYPISFQPKMQSVAHWQILADDTAAELALHLDASRPVYVAHRYPRSEFGQAFEGYLTTALVNRGIAVSGSPVAATTVDYGVQRIDHQARMIGRSPPGLFTLLGFGVWLGHQAATHWGGTGWVAGIPAGVVADLADGVITAPTNTEVVITVAAVSADGRYLFREDRNYYVNDADGDEYPDAPLVIASGTAMALPSRAVTLVNR